jgi:hypothetical protein
LASVHRGRRGRYLWPNHSLDDAMMDQREYKEQMIGQYPKWGTYIRVIIVAAIMTAAAMIFVMYPY